MPPLSWPTPACTGTSTPSTPCSAPPLPPCTGPPQCSPPTPRTSRHCAAHTSPSSRSDGALDARCRACQTCTAEAAWFFSPPGGSATAEPPEAAPCAAAEAPVGYVRARVTGTGKLVWMTSSPFTNGSICPHVPGPPPRALKPQPRDHLADLLKYRTSRVGPNLTGSDTSSLVRSSGDKRPSARAGTKPEWTGHGGLPISREGMGRARHGAQRREDDSVNPSAPTAHP